MGVSRTQRVIGALVNAITLNGLIVGNLILLVTSGRTIGGIVAGYKYESGGIGVLALLFTQMLEGLLSFITFSIFWWFDIFTMEKRDGMFYEKWAHNKKINRR